jgi:hypothetical protein
VFLSSSYVYSVNCKQCCGRVVPLHAPVQVLYVLGIEIISFLVAAQGVWCNGCPDACSCQVSCRRAAGSVGDACSGGPEVQALTKV